LTTDKFKPLIVKVKVALRLAVANQFVLAPTPFRLTTRRFLSQLMATATRYIALDWTEQKTPFAALPLLLGAYSLSRKLVYWVVTEQRLSSSVIMS
jgi:hypothetical protein